MIAELERRLADVLGAQLAPPFAGQVRAASETPAPGPSMLVGVRHVERVDDQLDSRRREVVPGDTRQRRVVRLRCLIDIEVRAGAGGRAQMLSGVDDAVYLLDRDDFRHGGALAAPGDPGFLVDELRLVDGTIPLEPDDDAPVAIRLAADGWFWPVEVAGQAGVAITEVRLRGVTLSLAIDPARPLLAAGGPAVELTIGVRATGPTPFGSLALRVEGPGARPGAGTLSGGAPGASGVRLLELVEGVARVTYTPPAASAVDELVVALDDRAGGAGVELGRFPLRVREAT